MRQRPVTMIRGTIIRMLDSSPSPMVIIHWIISVYMEYHLPCVGLRRNKPLLLNNESFIPFLVDALLLDPAHPRNEAAPDQKAWCQMTHAASLAQLAVFPEGREALCRDPSVSDALRSVAEAGLCEEAQQHVPVQGQRHVMLSCEWLCTAPNWPG